MRNVKKPKIIDAEPAGKQNPSVQRSPAAGTDRFPEKLKNIDADAAGRQNPPILYSFASWTSSTSCFSQIIDAEPTGKQNPSVSHPHPQMSCEIKLSLSPPVAAPSLSASPANSSTSCFSTSHPAQTIPIYQRLALLFHFRAKP